MIVWNDTYYEFEEFLLNLETNMQTSRNFQFWENCQFVGLYSNI